MPANLQICRLNKSSTVIRVESYGLNTTGFPNMTANFQIWRLIYKLTGKFTNMMANLQINRRIDKYDGIQMPEKIESYFPKSKECLATFISPKNLSSVSF